MYIHMWVSTRDVYREKGNPHPLKKGGEGMGRGNEGTKLPLPVNFIRMYVHTIAHYTSDETYHLVVSAIAILVSGKKPERLF